MNIVNEPVSHMLFREAKVFRQEYEALLRRSREEKISRQSAKKGNRYQKARFQN